VFAWIATIWTGRPAITTAFLYFASVIVLFVIGGVSGFMTASVPVDWQLTDTYFVVAHLHYVLIGINLFAVAGGIYHWFPKMTGRLLDERFGRWTFWTMFVGFNLAFLPMHVTGLLGMPRRVYTYQTGYGWDTLNLVTSVGSVVFAIGVLMLIVAVLRGRRSGAPAGANPWGAPTLEWSVSSPPPAYNFLEIPIVASRFPLWEPAAADAAARSQLRTNLKLEAGRETLATSALDADVDLVMKMPEDTIAPLVLTIGMALGFIGLLVHASWLAAAGALVTLAAMVAWLWPRRALAQVAEAVP
jgi:heme/copper-type cytochrome/quinol oxidase subunit 1